MLCLAFDTATPWGRFAVARDGEVLLHKPHNVMGSYADAILKVMDETLAEAGVERTDLDLLAATRGPGSFTGVRIGVATAKALAYALGVPLAATPTLEAMAAAMLLDHADREWAVPTLDARRGEIFAGVYRRAGDWVEAAAPPRALSYDDWWREVLATVSDPEAPAYAGSGTALLLGEGETLRPELASRGEPVLRAWSAVHPATAAALAAAASRADAVVPAGDPFALTPLYLRASDAEVQRGLDLTPRDADEGLAVLEDRRPDEDAS